MTLSFRSVPFETERNESVTVSMAHTVCACDSTVYTVYTTVHACTVYMYRNYKCTSIKGISLGSVSTMSGSGSGSVGVDGRLKQECMKSLMVYMYIIPQFTIFWRLQNFCHAEVAEIL